MSQTRRALVMLALWLALATMTTVAHAHADDQPAIIRHRALGQLELMVAGTHAAPRPPTIEDQHDRLLRHLRAEQATRTLVAVQLARSLERNLTPAPIARVPAAQPAAPTGTAMPSRGVDVLATLLVGLVGGLVGGAAAMAGWTATTRRRVRRAASTA